MISNERLSDLSSVAVDAIEINELVEINSISVNKQLPKEARILRYIDEIKNPYCFRVGSHAVKMQFSSSGLTLQNALVKSVIK